MPPRKSDVSKIGEGEEGTPAKETLPKEGINIEVLSRSASPPTSGATTLKLDLYNFLKGN